MTQKVLVAQIQKDCDRYDAWIRDFGTDSLIVMDQPIRGGPGSCKEGLFYRAPLALLPAGSLDRVVSSLAVEFGVTESEVRDDLVEKGYLPLFGDGLAICLFARSGPWGSEPHPKISDRCPSCGSKSLFIGSGGWLTCSILGCKQPSVSAAIDDLVAERDAAEPREEASDAD